MLVAMIMGGSGPAERSIAGSSQVQYIYTGSDGTLYMFFDDHIQAIDMKGNELWDFVVPDKWNICNGWRFTPDFIWVTAYQWNPIAFADNGTLYVYLKSNESYSGGYVGTPNAMNMSEGLIAISDKGKVLWDLPLDSLMINSSTPLLNEPNISFSKGPYFSDANVFAQGNRIYVYHDHNETILDKNGSILWNIDNVADPVSVDEDGFVYSVPARIPDEQYSPKYSFTPNYTTTLPNGKYPMGAMLDDYRVPSAVVDAYYPNGSLYWCAYPGSLIYRQYLDDDHLPARQ